MDENHVKTKPLIDRLEAVLRVKWHQFTKCDYLLLLWHWEAAQVICSLEAPGQAFGSLIGVGLLQDLVLVAKQLPLVKLQAPDVQPLQ